MRAKDDYRQFIDPDEMAKLLAEIDRDIARSKRRKLMLLGYRGQRLNVMMKALRGSVKKSIVL